MLSGWQNNKFLKFIFLQFIKLKSKVRFVHSLLYIIRKNLNTQAQMEVKGFKIYGDAQYHEYRIKENKGGINCTYIYIYIYIYGPVIYIYGIYIYIYSKC